MECWSFFSLKSTIKGWEPSESGDEFQPSSVGFGGCSHWGPDTVALVGVGLWKSSSRSHISSGKAECCGPKAREPEPSWALAAVVLGGGAGGGRWRQRDRAMRLWWGWHEQNSCHRSSGAGPALWLCTASGGTIRARADPLLWVLEFGLQSLAPCSVHGNRGKTRNRGAQSKGSQPTQQESVRSSLGRCYLTLDCDCCCFFSLYIQLGFLTAQQSTWAYWHIWNCGLFKSVFAFVQFCVIHNSLALLCCAHMPRVGSQSCEIQVTLISCQL